MSRKKHHSDMVGKNLQTYEETSTKYWFKRDASRDITGFVMSSCGGNRIAILYLGSKKALLPNSTALFNHLRHKTLERLFGTWLNDHVFIISWMNVITPTCPCVVCMWSSPRGASLRSLWWSCAFAHAGMCAWVNLSVWCFVKFCFWPRLCNGAPVVFKLFMTSVGSL